MSAILPAVEHLTPAEKLDLVAHLWDEIARKPANIPISEEAKSEVLRRAAWRQSHPGHGKSFAEIANALGVRL